MKQNKTTNNAKGYNININNRLTLPTGTYDANNNNNNCLSYCSRAWRRRLLQPPDPS